MFQVEFYNEDGSLAHNATIRSMEELEEVADGRRCRLVGSAGMGTNEAMAVVKEWGEVAGERDWGTLEILEAMAFAKRRNELSRHQDHAHDVVLAGFRQLFFGGE